MMRNEPGATTDIKHFGSNWYYSGNLKRHVVSASDFSAASLARPATFESAYERSRLGARVRRSLRYVGVK